MIDVIGAPFDLCGLRLGSRLGPAAIRLAGLVDALQRLGYEVNDRGDFVPSSTMTERTEPGGLVNLVPLATTILSLQVPTHHALQRGALPLVLGGDHTLAAAGVAAALKHFDGDLALLWIDAHADVNTPGTSETGNLHGMPVAALAGLPSGTDGVRDKEWQMLQHALGNGPRMPLERIGWFGLRDVDPPERDRLRGVAITMHDIDRRGVEASVARLTEWLRGTGVRHLWISFDVDALDPILAPGTGTAVRGGLTYREAHLMAELLREAMDEATCPYRLVGVDVVETNPLVDSANQTAVIAVEWVASLFGKTVLGGR